MGRYEKGWSPLKQRVFLELAKGTSTKEIALKEGLSRTYIYKLMNTELFREKRQLVKDDALQKVKDIFNEHAVEAATKVATLLRVGRGNQRLQFEAAIEILRQIGANPATITEIKDKREVPQEEVASTLRVLNEIEEITGRIEQKGAAFLIPALPQSKVEATTVPVEEPLENAERPSS